MKKGDKKRKLSQLEGKKKEKTRKKRKKSKFKAPLRKIDGKRIPLEQWKKRLIENEVSSKRALPKIAVVKKIRPKKRKVKAPKGSKAKRVSSTRYNPPKKLSVLEAIDIEYKKPDVKKSVKTNKAIRKPRKKRKKKERVGKVWEEGSDEESEAPPNLMNERRKFFKNVPEYKYSATEELFSNELISPDYYNFSSVWSGVDHNVNPITEHGEEFPIPVVDEKNEEDESKKKDIERKQKEEVPMPVVVEEESKRKEIERKQKEEEVRQKLLLDAYRRNVRTYQGVIYTECKNGNLHNQILDTSLADDTVRVGYIKYRDEKKKVLGEVPTATVKVKPLREALRSLHLFKDDNGNVVFEKRTGRKMKVYFVWKIEEFHSNPKPTAVPDYSKIFEYFEKNDDGENVGSEMGVSDDERSKKKRTKKKKQEIEMEEQFEKRDEEKEEEKEKKEKTQRI